MAFTANCTYDFSIFSHSNLDLGCVLLLGFVILSFLLGFRFVYFDVAFIVFGSDSLTNRAINFYFVWIMPSPAKQFTERCTRHTTHCTMHNALSTACNIKWTLERRSLIESQPNPRIVLHPSIWQYCLNAACATLFLAYFHVINSYCSQSCVFFPRIRLYIGILVSRICIWIFQKVSVGCWARFDAFHKYKCVNYLAWVYLKDVSVLHAWNLGEHRARSQVEPTLYLIDISFDAHLNNLYLLNAASAPLLSGPLGAFFARILSRCVRNQPALEIVLILSLVKWPELLRWAAFQLQNYHLYYVFYYHLFSPEQRNNHFTQSKWDASTFHAEAISTSNTPETMALHKML